MREKGFTSFVDLRLEFAVLTFQIGGKWVCKSSVMNEHKEPLCFNEEIGEQRS